MFNKKKNNEIAYNVETKKEKKIRIHWLTKILIIVDFCAIFCFVTAYSNLNYAASFRNWLVTSALGTGKHKYLAYVLYSEDDVQKIVDANTMTPPTGISNIEDIQFVNYDDKPRTYANEYEKQVLEKDPGNDMYKIIEIREKNYAGFIAVIYQPTKLNLVTAQRKYGDYISTMAKQNNAILATNISGFYFDSSTHYMVPCRDIIKNHEIYFTDNKHDAMIGMNDDGVLMLGYWTGKEAIDLGMKWGVHFGPFLIVNGQPATFTGNGGYGIEPRTAIGQRKDGIVLLVVIDGRGFNNSLGIGMGDLTDIFIRYGCYNAANLDGGGSSTLVVKNEVINYPCEQMQLQERFNVSALIYK